MGGEDVALTVSMYPLPDHEILLFVLDSLQACGEVPDLPLDGQHVSFVGDIDDTVYVERDSLVRDGAELVAEAVGVSAVILGCERVGAGIFLFLFEQCAVFGVDENDFNIEVSATADLVREGHLIAMMEVFEEALFGIRAKLDHVCPTRPREQEYQEESESPAREQRHGRQTTRHD